METIAVKLDEKGFREVFDKYYVALCVFALRYTDSPETSADIVQDCYAKLWMLRADFGYLHQVKSFLYTSVRNKALDEMEHCHVVDDYVRRVMERKDDAFFHDRVVESEACRLLLQAIDHLPPQMKNIMQLALDGRKNQEIADALGVSLETVRTLKKTAYKKLRVELKDCYWVLFLFV